MKHEWTEKLVRIAERELNGETLSREEEELLRHLDAIDRILPGTIADGLLAEGFGVSESMDSPEEDEPEQIAAQTTRLSEPLAFWVHTSLRDGQTDVLLPLAGSRRKVLTIDASNRQVSLCFLSEWTFTMETSDKEMETVTPFGGVYRRFEELDNLYFHVDETRRRLRIDSRPPELTDGQTS